MENVITKKTEDIVISVRDVVKSYKELLAVDGLSFDVPASCCFGFLGPNGAGKTTMMKMLYGKARRDNPKHQVNVFGYDPCADELAIKYVTGIVSQNDNLDMDLSVEQNLKIYSKFYGMPWKTAKERIEELLDFMQLSEKRKAPIRALSGGMQRRLVIARALLNKPRLLILDEPTTGLDPQVRHLIWEKLHLLKKEGVTILLTTHYMEEAFQLCDALIMMHKGKKVLQGKPIDLIDEHIEKFVLEIVSSNLDASIWEKEKGVRIESTHNKTFLYANSMSQLEKISLGLRGGEFYLRQSNLEDVFLKITGRILDE